MVREAAPGRSGTPREATSATRAAPTLAETLRYFARLLYLLRGYWSAMAKNSALGLLLGFLTMAMPYASKSLIDTAYPAHDVTLMQVLVAGLVVLTVSSAVMSAVRSYFAQIVTSEMSTAAGLAFFNHLQHLPAAFFDSHQVGEVLSRFSDVRSGIATVTSALQTLVTSGVYLIVVPPFLLLLSWKLALLSLLVVPITVAVSTVGARYTRRYAKETAEVGAELQAYQIEVLTHVRTLKSMAMESNVYARLFDLSRHLWVTSMRGVRAQTAVGVINATVRAFGTGLYMWYAWTMIMRGDLTLGSYVAFGAYLAYLTGPVGQVAGVFTSLQSAGISLGRMFEYLDAPVEQDPAAAFNRAPAIVRRLRGHIELRDVSFHYEPGAPILENVDLVLPNAAMTAIVGPSGAGKSTLLRLIPRLIDPTRGEVLIDGTRVGDLTLLDLRRQVAVVWQEFSLMRGSVWENITMRAPDVSRAAAARAVEVCCLEDLLSKLPAGLDAPVGEWGATLSGGQRQRLAIARALVRDTPILLLDEATSNLDVPTEEKLLDRLLAHSRDRTIVIITHRPATAARAAFVWAVADGGVTAVPNGGAPVPGASIGPSLVASEAIRRHGSTGLVN